MASRLLKLNRDLLLPLIFNPSTQPKNKKCAKCRQVGLKYLNKLFEANYQLLRENSKSFKVQNRSSIKRYSL